MVEGILDLTIPFLAGFAIGGFFFGGLWLTVRVLVSSRMPALVTAGSFLLRTGVVLLTFHTVTAGRWQNLFACLIGFLLARKCLFRIRNREGQTVGR